MLIENLIYIFFTVCEVQKLKIVLTNNKVGKKFKNVLVIFHFLSRFLFSTIHMNKIAEYMVQDGFKMKHSSNLLSGFPKLRKFLFDTSSSSIKVEVITPNIYIHYQCNLERATVLLFLISVYSASNVNLNKKPWLLLICKFI